MEREDYDDHRNIGTSASGGQAADGAAVPAGNTGGRPANPPMAPPTKSKNGCLVALVIVLLAGGAGVLLLVGFLGFIAAVADSLPSSLAASRHTESFIEGNVFSANKIAVVEINGVILRGGAGGWGMVADAGDIDEQLRGIAADPSIRAVIVNIDTPGGEVVASDLIHHRLRELREDYGIPVVAVMNAMATSGGYYVAVACDHIIANRLTLTGSIGVIIQTFNYHELLGKIGVAANTFKSGAMKDLLDGSRPPNPAEAAIVQELVDETYREFARLVAEGRPEISLEKVLNSEIGDGRVFSGAKALELGMVDQLGFFEDAVEVALELAGVDGDDYQLVGFERAFSFADILRGVTGGTPARIAVEVPGTNGRAAAIEPGKLYFLPSF